MPFKFAYLCDLLSKLEALCTRDPPLLLADLTRHNRETVTKWFSSHRARIDAKDTDLVALLSSLFPERRTDRVFSLQAQRLTPIIARCLNIGLSRKPLLWLWKEAGKGDLGACVERVLREAENPRVKGASEVTVEEVDQALAAIAGNCRFSGPAIRGGTVDVNEVLGIIGRRLQSREAKWFTRMILKDFTPVLLPQTLTLSLVHFLLPDILKVQDHLQAAVAMLRDPVISQWPPMPRLERRTVYKTEACKYLVPKVGVKVGRTPYLKAWSVEYVLQVARRREMSLERKYDGEYCQIHIDLAKGEDCIQVFSKSGKDSTSDRIRVHETIRRSLRIGTKQCSIAWRCILEGELVVWSDKEQKIQAFHKLRKYLPRSGSYLGTAVDSQTHDYEHLMIIYYDLMLVDDSVILSKPHRDRRRQLQRIVTAIPGRSKIATRMEIDFSTANAARQLRKAIDHAITQCWEGYVLKPSNEPYFTFREGTANGYASCWMKIKKDYIKGLGDTADFAVIGAGYDAIRAAKTGLKNLSWTHFHIGCLENKKEVLRFGSKPSYVVIDVIDQIPKHDIEALNQVGKFRTASFGSPKQRGAYNVKVEAAISFKMVTCFTEPFILEVLGSGFEKPQNRNYFILRFPRVLKIHWDRNVNDLLSFEELNQMAEEAMKVNNDHHSQEDATWIESLERSGRNENFVALPDEQNKSSETQPIERSNLHVKHLPHISAAPLSRSDGLVTLQPERLFNAKQFTSKPKLHLPCATSTGSTISLDPVSLSRLRARDQRKRRSDQSEICEFEALRYKKKSKPSSPAEIVSDCTNFSRSTATGGALREIINASRRARPSPPKEAFKRPYRMVKELASSSSRDKRTGPPLTATTVLTTPSLLPITRQKLDDCCVLLSPCVASMPLLTEDLLPASSSVYSCYSPTTISFPNSARHAYDIGYKISRDEKSHNAIVVLVEPHRANTTVDMIHFLGRMAEQYRSLGFAVYDWRLLEHFAKKGNDSEAFLVARVFWVESEEALMATGPGGRTRRLN